MMRRRDFLHVMGSGLAAEWPLGALAQQPIRPVGKIPHEGILMPGPETHSAATLDPFYRGLHDLGYIEGQNLSLERRNCGLETRSVARPGDRTGCTKS